MMIIKELFIKAFDPKLIFSALLALAIIHVLGKFVTIHKALEILGAALVFVIGIAKDLLPKFLENKVSSNPEMNNEIKYRLSILEERIEDCYQIALKAQAAIDASGLDELLEEERLNTKHLKELNDILKPYLKKCQNTTDEDKDEASTLME